jgi:hypothetical protein
VLFSEFIMVVYGRTKEIIFQSIYLAVYLSDVVACVDSRDNSWRQNCAVYFTLYVGILFSVIQGSLYSLY